MTGYAIEGGAPGKERLDVLSAVTRPATLALLARAGVRAGQRCVDVGCGAGSVSRDLARLVGEGGSVLGIDFDADVVALARADADAEGLANVSFHVGDATSIVGGTYDVAYARFVLSHVPDPAAVVGAMVTALAPGGVAILEDTDFSGAFCFPASEAFDRAMELYGDAVRGRGGDPDVGRALPAHVCAAGLADVDVCVSQPAALRGPVKRVTLLTQQRIRASLLELGLARGAALDELEAELSAYLDDPTTFVSTPRIVQAWGRTRDA
jgi:SAM-dependent methyltransferase